MNEDEDIGYNNSNVKEEKNNYNLFSQEQMNDKHIHDR